MRITHEARVVLARRCLSMSVEVEFLRDTLSGFAFAKCTSARDAP